MTLSNDEKRKRARDRIRKLSSPYSDRTPKFSLQRTNGLHKSDAQINAQVCPNQNEP